MIYPDYPVIEEGGHRFYVTPYGNFPSMTTVLGNTASEDKKESLKQWRESIGQEEADRISKEATDSGTAVHLMIEKFLNGDTLELSEFAPRDVSRFRSMKFLLKSISNVKAQEVALCSPSLKIAGRVDCIADFNGILSIIDFKTSRKIKRAHEIEDYFLQLTGYAIMHNELYGTNISHGVILMTCDDGFPLKFTVKLEDYIDKFFERIALFYERGLT